MLPCPARAAARGGSTARESKNEPEKKGTVRSRRNCLRKCGDLPRGSIKRICLPLVKDHPNAAVRGRRIQKRKIYRNRPLTARRRRSRNRKSASS
jgi:hypothetical protein